MQILRWLRLLGDPARFRVLRLLSREELSVAELAGRFGRSYVPGRSWKALAEMLLRLLPPLVIADVGAGEGTLALMLARSAERVIAVDSSRKMVEYGVELVARNGIANLD